MKRELRTVPIIVAASLLAATNVYAESWNCSRDNLVREVVIEYPQGSALPCKVVYKKQTEGVYDQDLWTSDNTEGYCEEKAAGLVAKLEGWGWVCLETVTSETNVIAE
jgi:hypothetical protein